MPLPEYEAFSTLDGAACHPWFKQTSCHLTMLLFERTATPTPRIRLHLCGNGFGKDLRYQLLARDDLCHCYDTKDEVNRVTHYAGRARRSALTISPHLWPAAPVQCFSHPAVSPSTGFHVRAGSEHLRYRWSGR